MLGAGAISVVMRGVSFTQVSPQTHKEKRKWKRSRSVQERGKKGMVLGVRRMSRARGSGLG